MRSLSATDAARRFSEILDAVEHRRETFLIARKGRTVAKLAPADRATGAVVKQILRENPRDAAWSGDLRDLRSHLTIEDRDWRA